MHSFDIIIVGGGIVGSAAALLLAQNEDLSIGLIDSVATHPTWDPHQYDSRVSAISFASQNIFEKISVWESINNKRVSPYKKMFVWDEKGSGKIHFDCRDVQKSSLGFIIEDSLMKNSLLEIINASLNISVLSPIHLQSINVTNDKVLLTTNNNETFSADLLIGADGANSFVREQAGIEIKTWEYHQTAIVTTVETEKSHESTAWQRFLKTGPLAFLPLEDPNFSSIVWSCEPTFAKKILELHDNDFKIQLCDAFENMLGPILSATKRLHFPLRMRHAKNYVLPKIALVGDAAHTIHPLLGQGVNMGLADALCLSNIINSAFKSKRDFTNIHTLRKYERERRTNNFNLLASADIITNLFSNDVPVASGFRNFALDFCNGIPILKNAFAQYAMGN